MQKYWRQGAEAEVVQWDGTEEALSEIKELLGDKAKAVNEVDEEGKCFRLVCKNDNITIYNTDWIVKDQGYFFVVSNDIFPKFFTEISDE